MPLFCRCKEAGILAKKLRKCELKWHTFCFCLLNRPVRAWPGRKNTWFCECHACAKYKYRSWSCCCWRFGKSHSACPSLWLTHPNYSVLTEKCLQIRLLNHPWHSLSWVNLCSWFFLKPLSLYISESWPYRNYEHQVSRKMWWHWDSLMSLGVFFLLFFSISFSPFCCFYCFTSFDGIT